MNAKEIKNIIEDVGKYFWIICNNDKCEVISVSNSKSDAKEEAKEELEDRDDIENFSIYFVKVLRSTDKGEDYDPKEHIFLPGPIHLEITDFDYTDGKLRESKRKFYQKVFFTLKYLKKNNGIKQKDICEMIVKHYKGELKTGLMAVNLL